MNSVGGPDLLIWLVLAFGGAMFVGNLMALVRPPAKSPRKGKSATKRTGSSAKSNGSNVSKSAGSVPGPPPPAAPLAKAPRSRTLAMMGIGGIASLWAIATLLSR